MGKKLDLTGKVFGRWTAVSESLKRSRSGGVKWYCVCECGSSAEVSSANLRSGISVSCGCYNKQRTVETHTRHGLCEHPLYGVWCSMKERCGNQKRPYYGNYGGRGISVCKEWSESFESFYKDVENDYKEGLQLDRINNDGDYEPSNIRWVTKQQNGMNKGAVVNSSSKYKGVSWHKQKNKWRARVSKGGTVKFIGLFTDEVKAALAYNEAAKELFGEYAYLNKIETNRELHP